MRTPNIILITSSQHRWDCAGFAGNPDLKTPNLDAMARHGLTFSQAICQAPLAAPSRATILTGQYPSRHGVHVNGQGLPLDSDTLPSVLRAHGYATAAVGEFQFTPMYANYGFDHFRLAEGYAKGRGQDDYHRWLESLGLEDQVDAWHRNGLENAPQEYRDFYSALGSNLEPQHYSSTWIGNESVRYLQAAKPPFFLWVSFSKPAPPYDPPASIEGMYKPSELRLPPDFQLPVAPDEIAVPRKEPAESAAFDLSKMTRRAYGRILANYYATITHMDTQIGRILATLTGRGHSNNIVVFTADRGDYMGQHGLVSDRGVWPYDALIRVPMIVSGVTDQRRGEVDESPVQLTDLMPTLLSSAHVPVPEAVQGLSLGALLRERGASLRDVATCIHFNGIRVARTAHYKMMALPLDEAVRFHDLKTDPGEHKNMAGDRATVRHQVAFRNVLRKLR